MYEKGNKVRILMDSYDSRSGHGQAQGAELFVSRVSNGRVFLTRHRNSGDECCYCLIDECEICID